MTKEEFETLKNSLAFNLGLAIECETKEETDAMLKRILAEVLNK